MLCAKSCYLCQPIIRGARRHIYRHTAQSTHSTHSAQTSVYTMLCAHKYMLCVCSREQEGDARAYSTSRTRRAVCCAVCRHALARRDACGGAERVIVVIFFCVCALCVHVRPVLLFWRRTSACASILPLPLVCMSVLLLLLCVLCLYIRIYSICVCVWGRTEHAARCSLWWL